LLRDAHLDLRTPPDGFHEVDAELGTLFPGTKKGVAGSESRRPLHTRGRVD
jgi:hypothetical protein